MTELDLTCGECGDDTFYIHSIEGKPFLLARCVACDHSKVLVMPADDTVDEPEARMQ